MTVLETSETLHIVCTRTVDSGRLERICTDYIKHDQTDDLDLLLKWSSQEKRYNLSGLFWETTAEQDMIASPNHFVAILKMTVSQLFTKQASPSCISYSNHQTSQHLTPIG